MISDKFIIIPESVYKNELNFTEMVVYGFIYSMSFKKGYCYAKNSFIQKELDITKPTLNRVLRRLIEKNFIQREVKGKIRLLKPLHVTSEVSNTKPERIKNNTKNSIKSDTYNSRIIDNKENKLINNFHLNKELDKEIKFQLVRLLEHLNKRYLKVSDYKIKAYEQKHMPIVFEVFRNYLGNEIFYSIKSVDESFYKYLNCFHLDLRNHIHKKRVRYYPYRLKGFEPEDFNFDNSNYKNEDSLKYKEELDSNDTYDPYANSVKNWMIDVDS